MVTIEHNRANFITIDVDGIVTSAEVAISLRKLLRECWTINKGALLYRLGNGYFPTPDAMMVKMLQSAKLVPLLTRFDKIAVVTDHGMLRYMAEMNGKLLWPVVVDTFTLDEEEAARDWLAGDTKKAA